MRLNRFLIALLAFSISLPRLSAQGNRDFMRETGKINVVVGVIVLIFLCIIWYLWRLDRRLTKIEHQISNDDE